MPITPIEMIPAKEAETSQTTQYTANTLTAQIILFTATNTSGSAATLSVNLVPPGGTLGDSNQIVDERSISPGETYTFPELAGHVIQSSGFISTIASAAGITIRASGVEITS